MSGLTLRVSSIDGGAALTLFDGRGAIEIRMGHRAVHWLAHDLDRAAGLDPPSRPVIDGVVGAEWVDQMLEIREQPVGVSKGGGCEPSREMFLRVIGALPDLDAVLDAPSAVFAFDAEPEGRRDNWTAGYRMSELEEDELATPSEKAALEASRAGQDGLEGGEPQGLVRPAPVVGQFDEETGPAGEAGVAEGDDRPPRIAGAAGGLPVDLEVLSAQPGQVDDRHPDLSCVSEPGVDAESPEGSCAPSAAEHAPGPKPGAGGAS